MLTSPRKTWQRLRNLFPVPAFYFDRPLVLLQSDDWGRVGLRDQAGLDQLHSDGIALGERPYDFYTLETAADVAALHATLAQHRDSTGRPPCLGMNFIQANLDFHRMREDGFRQIQLLPLCDGLPEGWLRPGLFEAYRDGIAHGVFRPQLHGLTHFCRPAIERHFSNSDQRGHLLRTLWQAATPYIYWRMPWIGYEYWDAEGANDRFLPMKDQADLIGQAVGIFSRTFSTLPDSACAPGYRANIDTHESWSKYGIRIAQNGPGTRTPPHFDRELLHSYRNVEFEPATDPNFSVDSCLLRAEQCFSKNIPAIVSLHSINFHSSVRDFRTPTLTSLHQFFSALEAAHPDLLYIHDRDLFELVQHGFFESAQGKTNLNVTRKTLTRARTRAPEA